MKQLAIRLEIEAFDVDHAPVVGFHDDRNAVLTGGEAALDFHVNGIALIQKKVKLGL